MLAAPNAGGSRPTTCANTQYGQRNPTNYVHAVHNIIIALWCNTFSRTRELIIIELTIARRFDIDSHASYKHRAKSNDQKRTAISPPGVFDRPRRLDVRALLFMTAASRRKTTARATRTTWPCFVTFGRRVFARRSDLARTHSNRPNGKIRPCRRAVRCFSPGTFTSVCRRANHQVQVDRNTRTPLPDCR